ncbi:MULTISPECIES: hypothetical protein [unclassified Sphingopyxis]|uniref:hypothetical protein n=1 Tax=unclassified Sphingopyxis TaxID=2614943 RepID=UPI000A77468E|nr:MULTISPECIES: hypothetical protein [unclassified Sphingopyxis]
MPEGTAKDLGTPWWSIRDDAGNPVARFDHRLFPRIRNGARVSFTGPDTNGVATNVQPAAMVARYTLRLADEATLSDDRKLQLLETVMRELQVAGNEAGEQRQKRLRRLRTAIDRYEF